MGLWLGLGVVQVTFKFCMNIQSCKPSVLKSILTRSSRTRTSGDVGMLRRVITVKYKLEHLVLPKIVYHRNAFLLAIKNIPFLHLLNYATQIQDTILIVNNFITFVIFCK